MTETRQTAPHLQLLTFTMSGEQYGVRVEHVREVLEMVRITKVPRTLDYMQGIINLRGQVVPVIDLRRKFGLTEADADIETAIIVMEIPLAGHQIILGIIADSVQEVNSLPTGDIEPPPQIGTAIDTRFIRGIGKRDDQFIIILEIEQVFDNEELAAINDTAPEEHPTEPVDHA